MTVSKTCSARANHAQKIKCQDTLQKSTHSQLDPLSRQVLVSFQNIVKRDLLFHSFFIGLASSALICFIFFFSFLADSFLMGIFVACFFFALVLYFVLK